MSDPGPPPVPVRPASPLAARELQLDRAALERVLARAAELQTSISDSTDLLSEAQLLEIGREVGLAPQHLRQALAEERARLADSAETDLLARIVGPGEVHARRVLHAEAPRILESLEAWMQKEECLQVKRRFPDRVLWEARSGFMSEMQRSLNIGGRGYHLSKAHEVAASVVPVDEGRVLVHLSADVRSARSNRVLTGGLLGGSGAAATAVLIVLGVMAPVAAGAALVGAGSGYLVARTHAPMAERVHLALEQVLDRLERGERPRANLLNQLKSGIAGGDP